MLVMSVILRLLGMIPCSEDCQCLEFIMVRFLVLLGVLGVSGTKKEPMKANLSITIVSRRFAQNFTQFFDEKKGLGNKKK